MCLSFLGLCCCLCAGRLFDCTFELLSSSSSPSSSSPYFGQALLLFRVLSSEGAGGHTSLLLTCPVGSARFERCWVRMDLAERQCLLSGQERPREISGLCLSRKQPGVNLKGHVRTRRSDVQDIDSRFSPVVASRVVDSRPPVGVSSIGNTPNLQAA